MAVNFPGPYEVRIFYTTNPTSLGPLTHQMRLNLRIDGTPAPGTPFTSIDALRRDDSPFPLDGEIDDWVTAISPLWVNSPANTIDYAELWKYEPESFDASYISTYSIAHTCTGATACTPAGQAMITFRTSGGGVLKINFLECEIGLGVKDALPFSNADADAVADAVVAGTFPWLGRDGTYPFACIALWPGQNEALFKRRFRD